MLALYGGSKDGTRCMALRNFFCKANSLINLARDAVKADVKKQQYPYILDVIQHLAKDVDALGDESRQERYSRGVGIILMLYLLKDATDPLYSFYQVILYYFFSMNTIYNYQLGLYIFATHPQQK